jgi:hypothetical protein
MTLATLDVSLNFSTGATFGNPFTLNDPANGILGTNVLSDTGQASLVIDLTNVTRSISISRGRNINRDTYEAGVCTVRIYDQTGRFNPQNTSSDLYGFLTPLRKLRISATLSGTSYYLFSGYTTDYVYSYDPAENVSYVDINASDAFRLFAMATVNAVTGQVAGQDTGTRIEKILDTVDFPVTMRNIDTGDSLTQVDPATSRTSLAALKNVETSEQGAFYVSPDGNVIFLNRSNTIGSAGGTPIQFNQTGGIPYENLVFAFDDKLIVNQCSVTRVGGSTQTNIDANSVAEYFPHNVSFSDLVIDTDAAAANIAAIYVATRSTTTIRIDQMLIDLYDPNVPNATILGLDYFDNVNISNIQPDGSTITKNLQIQGVNWEITPNSWKGRFVTLEPITDGLILNSASYGLLNDDVLAY